MGGCLSVTVLPDAAAVHAETARRFKESCLRAVRERGVFSVALAGGSTPRGAYERLAAMDFIPWQDVEVYFGDERCVPPDDQRSNYLMARQALLDHVPLAPDRVHRIPVEVGPEPAAREYERVVASVPGGRLDLVHLGVGPDGHVASLFPASDLGSSRLALVTTPTSGLQPAVERVSLTMQVICAARECLVLATGQEKRAVLEAVFEPGAHLPASVVARAGADWILDEAAVP